MRTHINSRLKVLTAVSAVSACTSAMLAFAADLPVPCVSGNCGATGPAVWITSGSATSTLFGNQLTVQQSSDSAVLNWQSFDIAAGNRVTFQQPDATAVALNRIFQNSPSRIFGALESNGQVYLVNSSGILFGSTAQVNVGGLVASTLNPTQAAIERGIGNALLGSSQAAFVAARDAQGLNVSGAVIVEAGAQLTAKEFGRVFLFAPEIVNNGSIRTPDGQTILAAGESIFLRPSADSSLRGMVVEVAAGGTVTNGTASAVATSGAEIIADRGNVTLMGLAVNQLGRVSATTSVKAGGSVKLLARDVTQRPGSAFLDPNATGTVVVGPGAIVSAMPDYADTTADVDTNEQPKSSIEVQGSGIFLESGSVLRAAAGTISLSAAADPRTSINLAAPNQSRVFIADGATVDVSGSDVVLPMERNVLKVELRTDQLKDSPLQRDDALRGQTIYVDVRETGQRADGSSWVGTPLADISGDISTIRRDVAERTAAGGSIDIQSQGDIIVSPSATLDVSGGVVRYEDGFIHTSLVVSDGAIYGIADADRERVYQSVANGYVHNYRRWGVTESYESFLGGAPGQFEAGYSEGRDAGSVLLASPRLILDGTVVGSTLVGPRQVQSAGGTALGNARPVNQAPLGAELVIGSIDSGRNLLLLSDIVFDSTDQLPALLAQGFNPRDSVLPAEVNQLKLSTGLFGSDAVSRARLYTNEAFRLDPGQQVVLPVDGSLTARAGDVSIGGTLLAPSGSITLSVAPTRTVAGGEGALAIASTALLDVSGRWVNDSLALTDGAPQGQLAINGGAISLSASASHFDLSAAFEIDVSGGGWLQSDGRLSGGTGGQLTITGNQVTPATGQSNQLGAVMTATGIRQGGSLQISADAICVATTSCVEQPDAALILSPQQFANADFSSMALTATAGPLIVSRDTQWQLQAQNFVLPESVGSLATDGDLRTVATRQLLSADLRAPVNLALKTDSNLPLTNDSLSDAVVRLETGSHIATDAGGALSLESHAGIVVRGGLDAPSGTIELFLNNEGRLSEFLPSQGIWIDRGARLSATATTILEPNDQGLRIGDVLPGGRVSINARRGYVVQAPGSVIDVSGASATLDTGGDAVPAVANQPIVVAASAGSIELQAAEGILLSGELLGRAAAATGAAGGSLAITLDAALRNDPGAVLSVDLFPLGARTIVLEQNFTNRVVASESNVPDLLNGMTFISSQRVADGGFDSLTLTARNLEAASVRVPGLISVPANASFTTRQRLVVDAATIASTGGDLSLQSNYVSIGSSDPVSQLFSTPVAGEASLSVAANSIEVVGASALSGFDVARFDAASDLQLRGVQLLTPAARALSGSLQTAGDLHLSAQQIYPTTLSQFSLAAGGTNNPRTIVTSRPNAGTGTATALSAGGSLRLDADAIQHDGVLKAPVGTLALNARSIQLGAGSITSVSADDAIIPFGSTQGGFDWVYSLPDLQTLVFNGTINTLPEKRLSLEAREIAVASGALIDVSGGGDLQAAEFLPGAGGTVDLLANATGSFAILPAASLASTPYDSALFAGSGILPGDAVYLEGAPGVPAGTYLKLPPQYALLPGGYLVTEVDGYRDLTAGQRISAGDGTPIVSGYQLVAGTTVRESRTAGFNILNRAEIDQRVRYATTLASDFFTIRSEAAARLPQDAGVVQLAAASSLVFDGNLVAQGAAGGRGASLEIASDLIAVSASASAVPVGFLNLRDSDLSRLGVETLVLGGRLSSGAEDSTRITPTASQVWVLDGAALSARQIVLTAAQSVTVGEDATVASSGAALAETLYTVPSAGAVVAVSQGTLQLSRDVGAGVGNVLLSQGSTLQADGSIVVDAAANVDAQGSYRLGAGGLLALGASLINVGDIPVGTSGLNLRTADLGSFQSIDLSLRASVGVDFYGQTNLTADELRISSPLLRASAGSQVDVTARRVELKGASVAATAVVPAGAGTLVVNATEIELYPGTIALNEFRDVTLTATDRFVSTGNAALVVYGAQAVNLRTPLIMGQSGSDLQISAPQANLQLLPGAGTAVVTDQRAGIGTLLSLSAASMVVGNTLLAPAGSIRLATTGDLTVNPTAHLDVSGVERIFDGVPVYADGGQIELATTNGNVALGSGAQLAFAGSANGGDAGTLAVTAVNGNLNFGATLDGSAAAGYRTGSARLDAANLGDLGVLAAVLGTAGATQSISLRQRNGNLSLASASTLRAATVQLVADGGGITIGGNIQSAAAAGGRVSLAARDAITVSGTIDASGTADQAGTIELLSSGGAVQALAGSTLNVASASDDGAGQIRVRLPAVQLATLLDANAANDGLRLAGTLTGSGDIIVEGFRRYVDADGVITEEEVLADGSNVRFQDASDFATSAPALAAALGTIDSDFALHLRPGIEIIGNTGLELASDWDLSLWQFDNEPGVLTLRTPGNLRFSANLSDGFDGALSAESGNPLDRASWSYRLAAGSDLASADPLAVLAAGSLGANAGDLIVGPGTATTAGATPDLRMIRTGDGYISIATGRDLVLSNAASVIYTAGRPSGGVLLSQLQGLSYPDGGGDIRIAAGRDVVGATTRQLITDWLWRTGVAAGTSTQPVRTAWTVNHASFQQNVATLGGGDLTISAQRDIRNLSASIPSIGKQLGTSYADNRVQVIGGGNLDVQAGRDITSGVYYVGLGDARLRAGGSLASSRTGIANAPVYTVLALEDGTIDVQARRDLTIETVVNPPLVRQGRSQIANPATYFVSYADDSLVRATSLTGNLTLNGDIATLISALDLQNLQQALQQTLNVYPANLSVAALEGSVVIGNTVKLLPAARGDLDVFAGKDITLRGLLLLSDTDPALLPSVGRPTNTVDVNSRFALALQPATQDQSLPHAETPVHATPGQPDGLPVDADPVQLIALTGNIVNASGSLVSAKPVRMIAGQDILNPQVVAQNLDGSSLTLISAGRDLVYERLRNSAGNLLPSFREVSIDGPGRAEVYAGRNIDLGASSGIVTRGNTVNQFLPAGGADLGLSVGFGSGPVGYDEFIARYLEAGTSYRALLREYLGVTDATVTDAQLLQQFRARDRAAQLPLLRAILLSELRASGRSAANTGSNDFTRGYEALNTLFPDLQPVTANEDIDPSYTGDLSLFFSRIYTLGGGSISVLAPGGLINAGLSTPPLSFGITKSASELGIVAQQAGNIEVFVLDDFLVNESRVFAADGGNILIWTARGDIDAGRGAKTAISAPAPTITFDPNGNVKVVFPAALTGSGIRAFVTTPGRAAGSVDLFAPFGAVIAGDAGIGSAGNVTIAATEVIGADNIDVGGVAVGVPVETGSLTAGLSGLSNVAAAATSTLGETEGVGGGAGNQVPEAQAALSWLEVFVMGLGEENCKPDDIECLKRQSQ